MTGRELIIELLKNKGISLDNEVALATKDGAFEDKEYAMFHIQKVTVKNEFVTLLMFYDIRFKGENKSEQADIEFNHKAFYEYLLNTINPNEMEKYRSMFLSNGEIVN